MRLIQLDHGKARLEGNLLRINLPGRASGSDKTWWIKGWDEGMMVHEGPTLARSRPEPDLYFDFQGSGGRHSQAMRFLDTLPIRQGLAGLSYRAFATAQFAARDERAAALLVSNPILLWLLVSAALDGELTKEALHEALGEPQQTALKRLGGSGTDAELDTLRKIVRHELGAKDYRLIREALPISKCADILADWPRVTVATLAVLNANSQLMDAGPVRRRPDPEFWLPVRLEVASTLCRDVLLLAGPQDAKRAKVQLQMAGNLAQLRRLRHLHAGRWRQRQTWSKKVGLLAAECGELPAPPMPGNDLIEPLISPDALKDESHTLCHDIAAQSHRVREGACYFYRVLGPKRATLRLDNVAWRLVKSGLVAPLSSAELARWPYGACIGGLAGSDTRETNTDTWIMVEQWLHRVQETKTDNFLKHLAPQEGWAEAAPVLQPGGKRFHSLPPFPGTESIVPILSREDLDAERRYLGIGIEPERVEAGALSAYRVLQPERALLILHNSAFSAYPDELWAEMAPAHRRQARTLQNAWGFGAEVIGLWTRGGCPPQAKTRLAVMEWLQEKAQPQL